MTTHGGKRPGAGRKKGLASVLAEQARAYIAGRVMEEIEPLVAPQIEKAKKGDTNAFHALFDRAGFKVKDGIELSGEDGGPLEITLIKYAGDKPPA